MKKNHFHLLIAAVLAMVMGLVLVACTEPNGAETTAPDTTVTDAPTEAPTDTPTEEDTTEEVTTLKPLEWESYDPALDDSLVNLKDSHIVDASQWIAQDGLDRYLPTYEQTGDKREDKIVAMFYWTWHGDFGDQQSAYNNAQNVEKLIAMGKTERDYFPLLQDNKNELSELHKLGIKTAYDKYHFWDEPIYGYYDGDDEWVIRKQAEMLAAAGVDVVFFDNTNGTFTWKQTAMKVMKVFSEARAQGVDAPDVSFMFPFGNNGSARTQIVELYNDIYSKGLYEDVWFKLDGKPMIMAWPGSISSNDSDLAKEILNFFTFRSHLAGYTDNETAPNQWGWLSRFPQAYFHNDKGEIEQMTVGTAVNHDAANTVIAPMSLKENVIGRTWTSRGYDTRPDALLYGACFSEQWENAIAIDPKIVFVTGWNEWVAMRIRNWPAGIEGGYDNCFVDQYNPEFSRDIEPSNGVLRDHYYYQLASYIRKFKGASPIEKASDPKLMDVNGGYGQWANVGPVYNDYFGLPDRDALGYKDPETGKRFHYTNDSGRNDIYDAKVARDYENIYFMVRTVENLTPYTDAYWMRLYLDMGESDKNWENYEFILNKANPDNETTATLERFTGSGFETEVVGKVTYSVKGNVLTVCIPKTLLGIPAEQMDFEFGFKWTDNTMENGDIMKWYVNGDVAPIGRYNYCYFTTGSGEFVPNSDNLGNSCLDFTNPERAEEIKTWMMGDVTNMDYAFTADGLRLTSKGAEAGLVIDYSKATPQCILDPFDAIQITYVVENGKTDRFRTHIGAGSQPQAQGARAKAFDLTVDGQVHTVTIPLKNLRVLEGSVKQVGLYFDKTAGAGESILIKSIQFVKTAE